MPSVKNAAMTHNQITAIVIDTSLAIHRALGPGLLESVYQHVLAHELRKRGLRVECEVPISVHWDGQRLDVGFRADMIVEGVVLIELKSVEKLSSVLQKVILTYLKLSDMKVGLLINFGSELLRDGIHRVANGLPE